MTGSINRKFLFDHVKGILFGGKFNPAQVKGIDALLDYWEKNHATKDDRWLAYVLGTAFHETAFTMQPIKEYGGDKYFTKMYDPLPDGTRPSVAKQLGNVNRGDGKRYPGRGFVQITGRRNYKDWTNRLGISGVDLEAKPDLALDIRYATIIIFEGMIAGTFTSKRLPQYFNKTTEKWVEARAIVNGKDKANQIAFYAKTFYAAISYTTGT